MKRYATSLEGVGSQAAIAANPSCLFSFCMCCFCCSKWVSDCKIQEFVSDARPGPTPLPCLFLPDSHCLSPWFPFLSLHSPRLSSSAIIPPSANALKPPPPTWTLRPRSLSGDLSACLSTSYTHRQEPAWFPSHLLTTHSGVCFPSLLPQRKR